MEDKDIRIELIKTFCGEYPNGYAKIGKQYIGIRTELFNFAVVRKVIEYFNNKLFEVGVYHSKPIVITLDEEYAKVFQILLGNLIHNKISEFESHELILQYIHLLDMIADSDEIEKHLNGFTIPDQVLEQFYECNISPIFIKNGIDIDFVLD